MKAIRFDSLTRSLGASAPRRILLGGLASVVVASFASLGTENAEGKRRKRKKKKKKQLRCGAGTIQCGKTCIAATECCGGCGAQTCCSGLCADLATSSAHCGVCNRACPSGSCIHGTCTCPGGQDQCPAACQCSPRVQGGQACNNGAVGALCDADDDCPLGSSCVVNGVTLEQRCGIPC